MRKTIFFLTFSKLENSYNTRIIQTDKMQGEFTLNNNPYLLRFNYIIPWKDNSHIHIFPFKEKMRNTIFFLTFSKLENSYNTRIIQTGKIQGEFTLNNNPYLLRFTYIIPWKDNSHITIRVFNLDNVHNPWNKILCVIW
jgi:hypothetical protein